MSIKLNFPLSGGGEIAGINNSGIETFSGKSLESLAKEIIQNSLDARRGENKVQVKFELVNILSSEVVELEGLKETFKKCIDYWGKRGDEEALKVLNKGLASISKERIRVLKVSDYGTIGLTNPTKDINSNFYNLVKCSGVSIKGNQAGGSFGIGKSAPFSCSLPRTLFYSTKTLDGEYGFQGVSRLVTHKVEGKTTQGVGYIGNPNENIPITDKKKIPSIFLRDDVGTDIYILGFNEQNNWESDLIHSSIENFFTSILDEKVEIMIGDTLINEESLPKCFERYYSEENPNNNTLFYYRCLTLEEGINKKLFVEDFYDNKGNNLGKVELHLLKEEKAPKKVAYIRNTGMKIIEKRVMTTLNFAGVIKFIGPKVNSFIRSLETPAHDKLEPKRVDADNNNNNAKNTLEKLNKFIRSCVRAFHNLDDLDKLEVKGLSQYLPDDSNEEKILEYTLRKGKVKSISFETYKNKNRKQKKKDENKKTLEALSFESLIPRSNDEQNNIDKNKRNRKTSDKKREGNSEKKKVGSKQITLLKNRVLINDSAGRKYKVFLESNEDTSLFLSLKSHYDTSKEIVKFEKVLVNGSSVPIVKESYAEIELFANKKNEILCVLESPIWSEMEVCLNAK